jgi:Zn-dependent protease/CBS domain-containing protein
VQLGTALGIPIRIHVTFLLLLVWFGYHSSRSGNALLWSLAYLLLVFTCVVLHELGHAAMARRFGVKTREIVLYPIGGIARLEAMPPGQAELLIALAGPTVNIALALSLAVVALVVDASLVWRGQLLEAADLLPGLFVLNLILFLFNLVPAFPMDGGRVLRAGLALILTQEQATRFATLVGQGVSILFGLAGIVAGNPLLLLIALFVFVGASQEAFFYRQRAIVLGELVRKAMITRFETLSPDDSLEKATARFMATHQGDFPVVDFGGRPVGMLTRGRLLQAQAEGGAQGRVADLMLREAPLLSPHDGLEKVLELLRANPECPVMVQEEGRLVGMITLANLAEYIQFARRGGHNAAEPPQSR